MLIALLLAVPTFAFAEVSEREDIAFGEEGVNAPAEDETLTADETEPTDAPSEVVGPVGAPEADAEESRPTDESVAPDAEAPVPAPQKKAKITFRVSK